MCDDAVPADGFRRGPAQLKTASLPDTLEADVEPCFLGAGGRVVRFMHAAEVGHEEVFAVELVVACELPLALGLVVVPVLTRTGIRSRDASANVAAPDFGTQVL